jgi:hypothetical protein
VACVKRPDRISEAMFCCHSWVSASFAVMASPLELREEAFLGLNRGRLLKRADQIKPSILLLPRRSIEIVFGLNDKSTVAGIILN